METKKSKATFLENQVVLFCTSLLPTVKNYTGKKKSWHDKSIAASCRVYKDDEKLQFCSFIELYQLAMLCYMNSDRAEKKS